MAAPRSFPGLLGKPVRKDDAKPVGLRATFGSDRNDEDIEVHVRNEIDKRLVELDRFFELDSNRNDLWEQRAKAIITHRFGIQPGAHWWTYFAHILLKQYVPGFKIKALGQGKRGRPSKTSDLFCQLFADVEFLRKKTGLSTSTICAKLPKKAGYEKRWGRYKGATLRKLYAAADKHRRKLEFELILCGPEAVFFPGGVNRIEAAIDLHALKV